MEYSPISHACTQLSPHESDPRNQGGPSICREQHPSTPLPLNPSDNLFTYTSTARFPPLPDTLRRHIQHRMDNLVVTTSNGLISPTTVRSSCPHLKATPKAGSRALAEIERIDINGFNNCVRAHAKLHIPSKPPNYGELLDMRPEMFRIVQGSSSDDQPKLPFEDESSFKTDRKRSESSQSRNPELPQEGIHPVRGFELTIPFNMPAHGFAHTCVMPERSSEGENGTWRAMEIRAVMRSKDNTEPQPRKGFSSPQTNQPLDHLTPGRLYRMGSGLAGMPLEFNESLDGFPETKHNGSSTSTASLFTSSSPSSGCAPSITSANGLSHFIISSLLYTAASVVQLVLPPRIRGWQWWAPGSGPTSDRQPSTESCGVACDRVELGCDIKIWGSGKGEGSLLLVIQPPWYMPPQTFTDFTQGQEFTDGARGEQGFLGHEKLWATLFDLCSARRIRYFAVTSFDQLTFGCFSSGYRRGHITPPISTQTSAASLRVGPNFLQSLVFWMLSSMETEDGWLMQEPVHVAAFDVDYRGLQVARLACDAELRRAPAPFQILKSLKRIRVERETGEAEIVPLDWWLLNQQASNKRSRSPKGAKVLSLHNLPHDDEPEIESYLNGDLAMNIDIVLNNGLHRRLGDHLIRMESLPSIHGSVTNEDVGGNKNNTYDNIPSRLSTRSSGSSSSASASISVNKTLTPTPKMSTPTGRAIKGLPSRTCGQKVSPKSNVTHVHSSNVDVVRGGNDEGGRVKGGRQRPSGRCEINLGMDYCEGGITMTEGVVAVGSPVPNQSNHVSKRREARYGANTPLHGLATRGTASHLPPSTRHSAHEKHSANVEELEGTSIKKQMRLNLAASSDNVRTRSQWKKLKGSPGSRS